MPFCSAGKTRTKDKYRVVYTDHQRLELEKEFHYSRYITIRRKSELAANLGLTERQVCGSSTSAQVTRPRIGLSGCCAWTEPTERKQRGCLQATGTKPHAGPLLHHQLNLTLPPPPHTHTHYSEHTRVAGDQCYPDPKEGGFREGSRAQGECVLVSEVWCQGQGVSF